MKTDSARDWLGQFLTRRGLEVPDSRPLYGYRTSTDEFDALRELVSSVPPIRVGLMMPRPEAACFCLFAAEWWRRNHEGGAWKWGGILDSVEWGSVTVPTLYGPIQEGLSYWSRPLLTRLAGRMFLVTLACEGGLPLKLLHQQHAWLRRYFQTLLQDLHRFRRYGTSATELARTASHVLPQGLRQEVVFELGGKLAEAVWELQNELGDTKTPVADLDRRDSSWRDRMPLVVEDDTARALLNNLIENATRIATRQVSGFSVVRSLRCLPGNEWVIEADVRIPPSIAAETLATLMSVDADSLPIRLQLSLSDGDNVSPLGLATRVRIDGSERFAVEVLNRRTGQLQGPAATRPYTVTVTSGGQSLGHLAVPGGGELGDLPWVFVESSESTFEMIGEGTVKTRNPDAVVAIPNGWGVELQDGASCDLIGTVAIANRQVHRVTGAIRFFDSEHGQCLTRCSATNDESIEYRLEGGTLPYGVGGSPVFKGVPVLVELQPNGGRRQVPRAQLECREWDARGAWRPLGQQSVGNLALRYVDEGHVRYRTRVQILPSEAVVTLAPSRTGRGGEIELAGWGRPEVGLSCLPTVEAKVESQASKLRISAIAKREVPAKVICHFRWSDARLDLEFPFPIRSGRFISREGEVLKHEALVSVDRLSAIESTVIDTQESGCFMVEVALLHVHDVPADIASTFGIHCVLQQVRPREHVLELRQLQENVRMLLGMTRELDALVELRIVAQDGDPLRPSKLFAQRFEGTFELDRDAGEVRLSASLMPRFEIDGFDRLEVEAWPMWLPEEDPVSLVTNGPGRWLLEPRKRAPGPWLIVGREGSLVRIRPTLWSVPGSSAPPTDIERLADIVRVPDQSMRSARFDEFLRVLAQDPNHPDWQTVFAYFQRYQHGPASTLMLFERLVANPDAAALCLIIAPEEQFDPVWTVLEQLPFLWALVPIASWLGAAERIAQPLRDAKISKRTIEGVFSTFARNAPARLPGLQVVSELLLWSVILGDGAGAPRPSTNTLQGNLMTAQQRLMSLHADDRWPTGTTTSQFRALLADVPSQLTNLWRDPLVSYRDTVTNAPIAAALSAISGVRLPDLVVHDLRRCRQFDLVWFDRAYELTLAIAVAMLPHTHWRQPQ